MTTSRALTLFFALALLALIFLAVSAPPARAADPVIVRVTTSGTTAWPCGDLVNWSNPCALQTALTRSVSPAEVWVAAGTYTPTTGTDRTATFQLRAGVALYGGFAGGEMLRTQRDFTKHVTILSGDLNGDDKGNVGYDEPTRAENSYHVVTGSGVTNTAVLDGFTVKGGNGNDYSAPNDCGGGMYNDGGSPTVANVTFNGNSASYQGGGMYNWTSSSPTLTNVTFSGNWTTSSVPDNVNFGGGMYNGNNSNPTLTNVTFSGNSTNWVGGGMNNFQSSPRLTNVMFISNTASQTGGGMDNTFSDPVLTNVAFIGNTGDHGGGMYNLYSNPTITNTSFISNTCGDYGGGMRNDYSSPTLTNVTFAGNTANQSGGGMYNDMHGDPTLFNVTFSNNSASQFGGGIYNNSSDPTLTNVTFIGNSAQNDSGGGMFNNWGNPKLTNVTFSGNSASIAGGGMYNETSSPLVRNTIFWGNSAPNSAQILDNNSTPSVSYSVVQSGYPGGAHIITADPWLGSLGNWGGRTQTIRLLPGSSAIDAGDDATCAPTDQRGVPRPAGLHCDIGAFEYLPYLVGLPFVAR